MKAWVSLAFWVQCPLGPGPFFIALWLMKFRRDFQPHCSTSWNPPGGKLWDNLAELPTPRHHPPTSWGSLVPLWGEPPECIHSLLMKGGLLVCDCDCGGGGEDQSIDGGLALASTSGQSLLLQAAGLWCCAIYMLPNGSVSPKRPHASGEWGLGGGLVPVSTPSSPWLGVCTCCWCSFPQGARHPTVYAITSAGGRGRRAALVVTQSVLPTEGPFPAGDSCLD